MAKEKAKEKTKATKQRGQVQKKKRIKYIAQPDSIIRGQNQRIQVNLEWQVIHHNLDLDNIYENVRNNVDLSGLKNIDFEKLSR